MEKNSADNVKYNLGYLNSGWNNFMIFLSCFGIIINLYFGITYIRRIYKINKSKTKNKINVSLIEKILCLVSLVETFISIGWLINSLFKPQQTDENKNTSQCKILGLFEIFFYLFDWMILSFSLYQIKKMVINPLNLLKPDLILAQFILIFAVISSLFVLICLCLEIVGSSPMLTCFIDISKIKTNHNYFAKIMFWIFFTSPIILFGFGFLQIFIMMQSNNYKNVRQNKKYFMKYFAYILIYIIMAFLLITLYLITYIYKKNEIKEPVKGMKLYIQIVTVLSCSTPLFVGIFRLIKTNLIRKCGKNENDGLNNNLLDNKQNIDDFNEFEQNLLRKIVIKFYIGISFVLGKSKYSQTEEENTEEITKGNNINDLNNDNTENNYKIIKENNDENKENIKIGDNKGLDDNIFNKDKEENVYENIISINEEKENYIEKKEEKNVNNEFNKVNEEKSNNEKNNFENIKDEKIRNNNNILGENNNNNQFEEENLSALNINNNQLYNIEMNDDLNEIDSNKALEEINLIIPSKEGLNLINEIKKYHITKPEILKDLDLNLNDDIMVLNQSNIDIIITEYCSQLFKKIREIDGISEDYIINLLQPKKSNVNLIQTFDKNSFYINSSNREFLIKEITLDELNFYKSNIINNIYQYLKINKKSIILRIQGLYDIIVDDSSKKKKQFFALMHNTYESLNIEKEDLDLNYSFSFKNNNIEKINSKKGIKIHKLKQLQFDRCLLIGNSSSTEKKPKFSLDYGNIKNIKQNLDDYRIYLEEKEYNRLKNIIKKDTKFLKKIGVLNYYYFVAEIPIISYNIKHIFNETGKGDNIKDDVVQHIKKYLFKSNKDKNIIYSISIVDYFKDPIKY